MPRNRNSGPMVLSEPVAIIDLTEDSPSNQALRRPRPRQNHSEIREEYIFSDDEDDSVIPLDGPDEQPCRRRHRINRPAPVLNLDETITLDDSVISKNVTNKSPMLPDTSPQKQDFTCPICLESIISENLVPMTTPCGHIYCLACLKKVTSAKKKCSLCQRSLTFSSCIRLHV